MRKTTVLFGLLVTLAAATTVCVADHGIPVWYETGRCFLPPVTSGARGSHRRSDWTLGVESIPAPDTTPFGLAFDGAGLWNASLFGRTIYRLDPASGSVTKSLPAPDDWCKGLCWDGAQLWVTGNYQSRIYRIDTTGNVTRSFPAPGSNPVGIAWDGSRLWCSDVNSDQSEPSRVFELDPNSGARLDSFDLPFKRPADLAWDGGRLWCCDMDHGIAYAFDPTTGQVVGATGTPGPEPTGIEVSGGLLWCSDWARGWIYRFHADSGPPALALASPAQWDVLPTWRGAMINGTVAGSGLDSFRVEYGVGRQPSGWQPVGPARGVPVLHDTLATWDLSNIRQAGEYSLRLSVFSGIGVDTSRVALIGVDPLIGRGWPKTATNVSPLTAADIADGPELELVAGTDHQNWQRNRLLAWDPAGDLVTGFPVPGISNVQMPPAAGDVNRSGKCEVATGFDLNHDQVQLVSGNGAVMRGWPQIGGRPGGLGYLGIPVLADMTSDSVLEVLVGGGRFSVWDTAGRPVAGWPLAGEASSPAAADFDGDCVPELTVVRDDSVYLYESDGGLVSGWPVGFGLSGGGTFPVVGDVDGDGRLEIALTLGVRLLLIDDHGGLLTGFPKLLPGNYSTSPVLGDVDNDDTLEIVVVSGSFPSSTTISVVRSDGANHVGWPRTVNGYAFRRFNGPVIGDVDADGFPDVLFGVESIDGFEKLFAWNREGEPLAGWPRLLREIYGYGITGAPLLGDFDCDGMLDCAVSSNAYWVYNTDVYVWNLGVPCNVSALEWPMFRHDREMTGSYRAPASAVRESAADVSRGPALSITPIPARSAVRLGGRALVAGVTVVVHDGAGRVVDELVVDGPGEMTWAGLDRDGRRLPAGVYFVSAHGAQQAGPTKLVLER